jgi:tetratricopeptide (TPR) repeat protein
MTKWTPFPHLGEYTYDADSVKQQWAKLHAGDAEPLPTNDKLLEAWALFHSGEFQKAAELGLALANSGLITGLTVANKATCIYANYLEANEAAKLALFMDVAQRAEQQVQDVTISAESLPNAYYWQAYALGRYSQGISIAKALAQGLGSKVKDALEKTIELQPKHADAHIALGTFHAEVIDKVGSLIGSMTYGAKKDASFNFFQEALRINTNSAIAMIEQANGWVMLEGEKRLAEATKLYEIASATLPLDAMERLDVDLAKAELND